MTSPGAYSIREAIKKLESYCAYQERCHKEVADKLRDMGIYGEAQAQVIVHLITQNYLNEERFSQGFVRGKFNIKKWGRQRLIRELKQRNISEYNIASGLKQIEEEHYLKVFRLLAEKKWGALKGSDLIKRKRKLADYLLSRGWENDLVWEKITELTQQLK